MYAINAGHRIFYTTAGKAGPWVVMSHSLACDHTMWEPQIERLAATHRVLAFDTRGHGASDPWASAFTLDDLAGDALAVMDAAGIERAHFIGLSMGGMIGQTLALSHPQRIASLVLANTSSRRAAGAQALWNERIALVRREGMEAIVQPTLQRWFTSPFVSARPALMTRIAQLIRRTPVAGYSGCAQAISSLDITDQLGAISCPVLVIAGRDDPSTTVPMHEDIHRAITGSQLLILEDAAHLSNLEQEARFSSAIADFLAAAPTQA